MTVCLLINSRLKLAPTAEQSGLNFVCWQTSEDRFSRVKAPISSDKPVKLLLVKAKRFTSFKNAIMKINWCFSFSLCNSRPYKTGIL